MRAWVDHVALCAAGGGYTCAVGTADTTAHFEPVEADRAQGYLAGLLRGYRRAQSGALPTYEKASMAYVERVSPADRARFADRIVTREAAPFEPNEGAMRAARRGFSDPWNDFTDDADAYVALVTRGRADPFVPEDHFARWALCLWAPLLTHKQPGVPS